MKAKINYKKGIKFGLTFNKGFIFFNSKRLYSTSIRINKFKKKLKYYFSLLKILLSYTNRIIIDYFWYSYGEFHYNYKNKKIPLNHLFSIYNDRYWTLYSKRINKTVIFINEYNDIVTWLYLIYYKTINYNYKGKMYKLFYVLYFDEEHYYIYKTNTYKCETLFLFFEW